jgi:hypothetical protein
MYRWLAPALALVACGRFNFGQLDGGEAAGDGGDGGDGDAAPAADADPLTLGLVAYYPMEDDPSDGKFEDASGNNRHAMCVAGSTCPVSIEGRHGNAVRFFGARCARVTYDPGFATPNAYSVAAWLWIDVDTDQVAFAKPFGSGDRDAWDVVLWSTGSTLGTGTCMESMNAAQTGHDRVCGPQAPLGEWFHVTIRWTGQAKALFMNGVKANEQLASSSAIDENDVVIGCDVNSGSNVFYLQGRVDELRIYDRGLSDAEIAALAQ